MRGPVSLGITIEWRTIHIYNCFNILFSKNNNKNKKRSGNYKVKGLIMIKKTREETDR